MTDTDPLIRTVTQIPVFLSSPSDVSQERRLVLEVIDRLNAEPDFAERVILSPVAWERRGGEVPMEAGLTPQEAINQGSRKPSQCAIALVIFWSRMGTPLPPEYTKPGTTERYQSGTEWEFLDALDAFRAARSICEAVGVLDEARWYVDLLIRAPGGDKVAALRSALE